MSFASGRRRVRFLPLLLLGLLVAHTASHPEPSAEGAALAGLQQIAVEAIGPVLAASGPSSALGLSLDAAPDADPRGSRSAEEARAQAPGAARDSDHASGSFPTLSIDRGLLARPPPVVARA